MNKQYITPFFSGFFTLIFFLLYGCSGGGQPKPVTEEIQGLMMVSIPAGSFQMGHDYQQNSSESDKVNVYYSDEQPVHTVTLSAFQISSTEITQGII